MTNTPKHSRRKPFVTPELTFFGQMHRIVMQSSPPPSSAWRAGGTARTRAPGEFTWE